MMILFSLNLGCCPAVMSMCFALLKSITLLNFAYMHLVKVQPGNIARFKKFKNPQSACSSPTVAFLLSKNLFSIATALFLFSIGIAIVMDLQSSKIPKNMMNSVAHSVFSNAIGTPISSHNFRNLSIMSLQMLLSIATNKKSSK